MSFFCCFFFTSQDSAYSGHLTSKFRQTDRHPEESFSQRQGPHGSDPSRRKRGKASVTFPPEHISLPLNCTFCSFDWLVSHQTPGEPRFQGAPGWPQLPAAGVCWPVAGVHPRPSDAVVLKTQVDPGPFFCAGCTLKRTLSGCREGRSSCDCVSGFAQFLWERPLVTTVPMEKAFERPGELLHIPSSHKQSCAEKERAQPTATSKNVFCSF